MRVALAACAAGVIVSSRVAAGRVFGLYWEVSGTEGTLVMSTLKAAGWAPALHPLAVVIDYGPASDLAPVSGCAVVAKGLSRASALSSLASLRLHLSALSRWHRDQGFTDPTKAPQVRQVLRGIGTAHVVGVVLLQDVATGGLRHNDVLALAHRCGECLHVLLGHLGELLDIAAVQPRRTAARRTFGE